MKVKFSKEANNLINFKDTFTRKIAIGTSIVNAQYTLTINEKNIIYLALARANQFKEIEFNKWYVVSLEDFRVLNLSRIDNAKVELSNAVKSLYTQSLKLKDENDILTEHRWVKSYRDINKQNTIAIMFNEMLLPHLMQLKKYASIHTEHLIGIRSRYTSRVLEIISQERSRGRNAGSIEIDIKDFITILEVPYSCIEFKYLNRDILKPVIYELKKLAIAALSIDQLKHGKAIYALRFRYEFY